MKLNFIEVQSVITIKLYAILEQRNRKHNAEKMAFVFMDECIADCKEQNLYTRFLQL